jgi:hypothetical protein
MAILKTEILGSYIEINYETNEHEKLIKLIQNFKKRLEEFPVNVKTNNKTIIFLAALKIEDQLEDMKKIVLDNQINKKLIDDQKVSIEKLKEEIIITKDKLNDHNLQAIKESNKNLDIMDEINTLEKEIELIKSKIKNFI